MDTYVGSASCSEVYIEDGADAHCTAAAHAKTSSAGDGDCKSATGDDTTSASSSWSRGPVRNMLANGGGGGGDAGGGEDEWTTEGLGSVTDEFTAEGRDHRAMPPPPPPPHVFVQRGSGGGGGGRWWWFRLADGTALAVGDRVCQWQRHRSSDGDGGGGDGGGEDGGGLPMAAAVQHGGGSASVTQQTEQGTRPRCKCLCIPGGCKRRPGRLVMCTECCTRVGPGCCLYEENDGNGICHRCAPIAQPQAQKNGDWQHDAQWRRGDGGSDCKRGQAAASTIGAKLRSHHTAVAVVQAGGTRGDSDSQTSQPHGDKDKSRAGVDFACDIREAVRDDSGRSGMTVAVRHGGSSANGSGGAGGDGGGEDDGAGDAIAPKQARKGGTATTACKRRRAIDIGAPEPVQPIIAAVVDEQPEPPCGVHLCGGGVADVDGCGSGDLTRRCGRMS